MREVRCERHAGTFKAEVRLEALMSKSMRKVRTWCARSILPCRGGRLITSLNCLDQYALH